MVALVAKQAVIEGSPLSDDELRLLACEKDSQNTLSAELQMRMNTLIEHTLDSEADSDDPKNSGNSLEWASDVGHSNIAAMIEDVCRSRSENLPPLRNRRWMADRAQLVGCGVVAVILLMLFAA